MMDVRIPDCSAVMAWPLRSFNHTGATSLAGLLATASNRLEADIALTVLGVVKGRDRRWPAQATALMSSC